MTDSKTKPDTDRMTLFCPSCDYDLTGATTQNCPECGKMFNPKTIRRVQNAQTIEGGKILVSCFTVALICFFASVIPGLSLWLAPGIGFGMFLYSAYKSWVLAKRLAMTKMIREQRALYNKGAFIALSFLGLWLAHITLGVAAVFGGCALALKMMGPINFH